MNKTIWQTYKCSQYELPEYALEAQQTWVTHNPLWRMKYLDDAQASAFVREHFGSDVAKIFDTLPLGVMKADMWRYMIIYVYGGAYADLDTECYDSIDNWLPDAELVVCPENETHFCQWFFVGKSGGGVLESIINTVISRCNNVDTSIPDFVHYHTGPAAFTAGILQYFNIDTPFDVIKDSETLNSPEFYCFGGGRWRIFHWEKVKNIYGSQNWNDGRYTQWIKEAQNIGNIRPGE